jgi:hypothetical protein
VPSAIFESVSPDPQKRQDKASRVACPSIGKIFVYVQLFAGQYTSYDNLKAAVKKILRGYQREETEQVIAFWSHWGFKSEYCNPASGNEKGGVEGELGWFRRNWLVPVPEASDLASLNEQLLTACALGRERTIIGRSITVGQAAKMEQPHLLPLAEEGFPIDEILFPLVVDGKGCVKVKTNWYSTPLWPGRRVTARVWPSAGRS